MAADPGHFEPRHAAHAIEQVAIVLQIDKPLDDAQLGTATGVVEAQFAVELPKRADIQGFTFAFGPLGNLGQGPMMGGRMYSSLDSELRIDRTSIIFRTTAYTRWDEIWGPVQRYFSVLLPLFTGGATIAAINLNFQDKFYWVGELALCRASRLLRGGSNYVTPHVYEARDLWHSHTGAFIPVGADTKRLLNVNLDCIDEPGTPPRRVVAITTGLTDQLNQPGYDATRLHAQDATNYFEQRMPELHNASKDIFRNVINDTMCQRIALVD